jgi:hypothetical protein
MEKVVDEFLSILKTGFSQVFSDTQARSDEFYSIVEKVFDEPSPTWKKYRLFLYAICRDLEYIFFLSLANYQGSIYSKLGSL